MGCQGGASLVSEELQAYPSIAELSHGGACADECDALFLVGHNPGMVQLTMSRSRTRVLFRCRMRDLSLTKVATV